MRITEASAPTPVSQGCVLPTAHGLTSDALRLRCGGGCCDAWGKIKKKDGLLFDPKLNYCFGRLERVDTTLTATKMF